ncbi:unnamed protein product [Moneuplotes crassus]|uniref:non-specific serine/threonine protein kinase n=1 Tax=Euplotes crassus TaxID=5936 RepID=A0AAD1XCA1_EUPCR|nr:unnamed protein product [Moneuplotes crassus]
MITTPSVVSQTTPSSSIMERQWKRKRSKTVFTTRNKKKIRFSDSYFNNFLESMDAEKADNYLQVEKMGRSKSIVTSPYLKRRMIKENIRKVYKIRKCIGTGQFGSVRLASPYSNLKEKYAIKSIPRDSNEEYIKQLEKELRILKDVDHPNIIKFLETYQDQKYYHFVIEYCSGGELFNRLAELGSLSETVAASIIKKLVSAIAHLHDKDICHRDLKPENILFTSKDPDAEIKLIDFGLSTYARKDRIMKSKVGTPFYVAPEVLEGEYQKSCDMWSIGVITYVILCGYPPFYGKTDEEIYQKIEALDYEFPIKDWKKISPSAKDFINKLLLKDPLKRMNPTQAMKHTWLMPSENENMLDLEVINRLKSFQAPRRLQTEFLLVLSNYIKADEVERIRKTFEAIDIDYSGWISMEELKTALEDTEGSSQIESIMDNIDFDKNGEINYSEFLAATIDRKYFESKETVHTIFKHFDIENKGVITPESLKKSFQRGSKSYTQEEIEDMISEVTGKKEINLKDFKEILSQPI